MQSSSNDPNQEGEPSAVSGGQEELHEKAPSPSTERSQQKAEDEPETLDSDWGPDGVHSQITMDLTSLTSHQTQEDESPSDSPPTVTDVSSQHLSDLCHLQQTLENSGGGDDESAECTEGVTTAEAEGVITEENTSITPSTATATAANPAADQETELPDETDADEKDE